MFSVKSKMDASSNQFAVRRSGRAVGVPSRSPKGGTLSQRSIRHHLPVTKGLSSCSQCTGRSNCQFGLPPWKIVACFPAATRQIPNLFDRNERLIFHQETAHGPCVLAMIGAFGVGRMTTGLSSITTNTGGKASTQAGEWPIERAQELGRFELGSTVILFWPKTQIKWAMQSGQAIRLGSPMGQQIPQTPDDI